MGAQLGPRPDRYLYEGVARPELLRQITGLSPDGNYVFLQGAGYKSLQRLVFADVNGGVLVALMPGESKPHAVYLYSDRRAEAFVGAASEGEWDVESNPHLAFFQAPAHQRLYMEPSIDLAQYVDLWQGPGRERIGGYWPQGLRTSLWPWLKDQGCASSEDDPVFDRFIQLLGEKRQSHLRPGLIAKRIWPADDVAARSTFDLATAIRTEANRLLHALDEPRLPTG